MFQDPLYRQIRRGLRDLKDGNTFEQCANDLLSKIFPSLAPREGGDDAGLDGLIANVDKSTVQLICTTGEDVLGNLSGSIESNLKKDGKSHACILATSQRLSNPRKRTLEDRADKLGRPLIHIYDQAAIAQLLYRDARWLNELLGLTGHPPPLSLFPITSRPLFDIPPLGREDDITKITNTAGDIVLVGQPGAGKTHLLYTAAKKSQGRFVVDEDITLVADGIRDIQPNFLIVDDAHSRLEFLRRLKLLRQQIDAPYRIVASCWPGQEDAVINALQLTKEKCHLLEGLSQKQIKEVIQSQKILGPEHLLAEIIHQSQGKPGLAVTLCRLCWESGTRDVVLGTALARDVKVSFEPLLGRGATSLLACFSIGGDAGMTLESVGRLTGKNIFEVKRLAEQLAAAGVLDISRENRISVHPFRLRQALVRDVFLTPPTLDLAPYLSEAPDFAATTRVLIEAKLMGGILSDELIRQRLQRLVPTDEQAAFERYAHLGRHESEWVLDNFPERLEAVAQTTLHTCPDKTIDMLLDSAVVAYKERSSQGWTARTADTMTQIKQWILSAMPNNGDAANRREILASQLEKWFTEKKEVLIAVRVTELVLSIKHEHTSAPPGEPMVMTFHFGIVAQNQLSKIASLWPKVLPALREALPSEGREIAGIFHEWVHPNHPGQGAPPEYERESREYARRMMTDLLEIYTGKWTFHYHLRNYAEKLGLLAKIQTDPIANVLYPNHKLADWESEEKRCQDAADTLASLLGSENPTKTSNLLTTIEEQAKESAISDQSWGRHVCRQIAKTSDNPVVWIKALLDRNAPAILLEFFLEKIAASNPSEAETWVSLSLEKPALQLLGVSIVLKHYLPENAIWEKASPLFKDSLGMIGLCVSRKEIHTKNLKSLLNHDDPKVSGVVAASLWGIKDDTIIPDDLFNEWRRAIVKHVDERQEHILEKIFQKHHSIAFDWIAWRLEGIIDGTRPFWFGMRYDRSLPAAIQVLTREQKHELINKLPRISSVTELARSLVGRDMELFIHLLNREELEDARLNPLRLEFGSGLYAGNVVCDFDEGWQKMAVAAMEKGFSEQDIFDATQGGGYSWSGAMSSMFASKLAPFEKLLKHSDVRLQKVGKIGFDKFSILRDQNLANEKRAAIRGELC